MLLLTFCEIQVACHILEEASSLKVEGGEAADGNDAAIKGVLAVAETHTAVDNMTRFLI